MIRLLFFMTVIMAIFYSESSHASFQHIPNMSAEWVRTTTRNAATDSADAVVYNPAGLSELTDGFHFNISHQTVLRRPEHRYDAGYGEGEKSYAHDGVDWFIPNMYGAFKKGKWSIFMGLYIAGSDGTSDYPDGSISTQFLGDIEASYINLNSPSLPIGWYALKGQSFKSLSSYHTTTIGAVYSVCDFLSLAAGIRYLTMNNTIEMKTVIVGEDDETINRKFDADYTGDGFGGILGINLAPFQNITIGIRYESLVALDVQTHLNRNDFLFDLGTDGEKTSRDFSAMIGAGIAYRMTPSLTTEFDVNWYMNKKTTMGAYMGTNVDYADIAGDSYSYGCSVSYDVSQRLRLSAGVMKTEYPFGDIDIYYTYPLAFESLCLDNIYVGTGFSYVTSDTVKINVGFGWTHYDNTIIQALQYQDVGRDVDVYAKNQAFVFGIGVDVSYR